MPTHEHRLALGSIALTAAIVSIIVLILTQLNASPAEGLALVRISDALEKPLYMAHAGDERLFVVEKAGRIMIVEAGEVRRQPFLDIRAIVRDSDFEQGLLGLAFDPDYADNGFFYVNYTGEPDGHTFIVRYQVSPTNPNRTEPNSAETVLAIEQPYGNHNGGGLAFGPDGYLYISTGDGGAHADPHDNAQALDVLLGKLLRIDVRSLPYRIPDDNPFKDTPNARPEIWALGLRNPWRFSFDRATGDLFIADVGEATWEEVNKQTADSAGGQNYGWSLFEGPDVFKPSDEDSQAYTAPYFVYSHSTSSQDLTETLAARWRCSITGGYVYRGEHLPELAGKYLYADYCSGEIWALSRTDGEWINERLFNTGQQITSFGEGADGELYITVFDSELYQLRRADQ